MYMDPSFVQVREKSYLTAFDSISERKEAPANRWCRSHQMLITIHSYLNYVILVPHSPPTSSCRRRGSIGEETSKRVLLLLIVKLHNHGRIHILLYGRGCRA